MEGAPIATGIGVSATQSRPSNWGLGIGVRRDAVVQRGLLEAYQDERDWADQRRVSVTPAIVWQPTEPEGDFGHSVQLSLGPTLQMQRGEQVRSIGAVEDELTIGRIVNDPGYAADNAYLGQTPTTSLLLLTNDTNRLNVGATLGLQYGLTYQAVSLRGALMGRNVTNVDGVTFGFGVSVGVSL